MKAKVIKQVEGSFDEFYEKYIGQIVNVLSEDKENDVYWLDIPNKFGMPETNWCAEELEFIE